MRTTLAVIDVQDKFRASEVIVEQVVHQIKLARRRRSGIVLVELGGPPSYDEIFKALHGYDKFVVTNKNSDDGSKQVMNAIYANHYSLERVRLCGVNTCACVQATATGLIAAGAVGRIEIANEATNCAHGNSEVCLASLKEKVAGYRG